MAAHPDHAAAQRALVISLGELAPNLVEARQFDAARRLFEEYLQIVRRLAAGNPASATAQRDLGVGFTNVGRVLVDMGKEAEARSYFEQGLAVRERLARAQPDNALFLIDLLGSRVALAMLPGGDAHRAAARRLADDLIRRGVLSRNDPLAVNANADPRRNR